MSSNRSIDYTSKDETWEYLGEICYLQASGVGKHGFW